MQQDEAVWPIVVIGAGAAGLLAGIFAGRAGKRVLLLDTRRVPGAKIRVSGGSRCNVLPSNATLDDFFTSGSAHAVRNILFSWPLPQVHHFFHYELGVPLKLEATGKVFPVSDCSKDVVDALLSELSRVGAVLRGQCEVVRVAHTPADTTPFALHLRDGAVVRAQRVVMACGGLSLPKTGSDGGGWRMTRALGHTLLPTYPALVPLLTDDAAFKALAGLALPVQLKAARNGRVLEAIDGDFLFTHHGFSGPAVLNASRHIAAPQSEGVALTAAFGAPDTDWDTQLQARTGMVGPLLREHLPRRLADTILQRSGIAHEHRLNELSRRDRQTLVTQLQSCPLAVTGNEGYRTAEVTAGGIPLQEVHTKSLESRVVPGLYFAGEMLDVTGRLGGYNFLWAWVTGRRAGLAASS